MAIPDIANEWRLLYPNGHPFRGLEIDDNANIFCDGIKVGRVYHVATGAKPYKLDFGIFGRTLAFTTLKRLAEGGWIHEAPGVAEVMRERAEKRARR